MDPKSHALAAATFGRINSGTFTESDVGTAWLTLREYVPSYPLVREFGDFVAHRERAKGRIYNHVSEMVEGLKNYPNTSFEVKQAFQESALFTELESALRRLNLPVPCTVSLRMMLVTTFFMIQFAQVRNPGQLKKSDPRTPQELLGILHPYIKADQYGLQLAYVDIGRTGATFWLPILWVDRQPRGSIGETWWSPKDPVRVEVRNFNLVILSLYQPLTPGAPETVVNWPTQQRQEPS